MDTVDKGLDGITLDGVPIEKVIDEKERAELRREQVVEAGKYRPAIVSNKGGRLRWEDTHQGEHGEVRTYTPEEKVAYILVEKEGIMSQVDFSRVPMGSRKKVTRLFELIRFLPTEFVSNEVIKKIKREMKIGDVQRSLFQLVQGGLLERSHDRWGRIVYKKTEVARGSDGEVARQIIDNAHLMYGYESPEERKVRRGAPVGKTRIVQRMKTAAALQAIAETPEAGAEMPNAPAEVPKAPAERPGAVAKVLETAAEAPVDAQPAVDEHLAMEHPTGLGGVFQDGAPCGNGRPHRVDKVVAIPEDDISQKWVQLMISYRKVQDVFPGMTVEEFLEMWVERWKKSKAAA